jgi:hypothetical protein
LKSTLVSGKLEASPGSFFIFIKYIFHSNLLENIKKCSKKCLNLKLCSANSGPNYAKPRSGFSKTWIRKEQRLNPDSAMPGSGTVLGIRFDSAAMEWSISCRRELLHCWGFPK